MDTIGKEDVAYVWKSRPMTLTLRRTTSDPHIGKGSLRTSAASFFAVAQVLMLAFCFLPWPWTAIGETGEAQPLAQRKLQAAMRHRFLRTMRDRCLNTVEECSSSSSQPLVVTMTRRFGFLRLLFNGFTLWVWCIKCKLGIGRNADSIGSPAHSVVIMSSGFCKPFQQASRKQHCNRDSLGWMRHRPMSKLGRNL